MLIRAIAGQKPGYARESPPSDTTRGAADPAVTGFDPRLQDGSIEGMDGGSMHDPRTPTAPRQLTDLGTATGVSPWRWSIVNLESIGRIVLPGHARP